MWNIDIQSLEDQMTLTQELLPKTDEIPGQVWVRIPDWPDYAVSGDGQVMRLTPTSNRHNREGMLLKPYLMKIGYHQITLAKKGKQEKFYIHRLVADAFVPNPENKPEVNHVDGNKANSHFSNLERATHQENIQHGFDTKLCTSGEDRSSAKLSYKKAEQIRSLKSKGWKTRSIAKKFNVSERLILMVCQNQRWVCKQK